MLDASSIRAVLMQIYSKVIFYCEMTGRTQYRVSPVSQIIINFIYNCIQYQYYSHLFSFLSNSESNSTANF